jgi:GNAT superfamily N-acetyltransferase
LQEKTRIESLNKSNIEDLIYVCSSKRLGDPIHQQGIKLKRQWLREMLAKYGSIAKIAYYDNKPTAHILYYPEEADVTKAFTRKNVLMIQCIYNPTPEAQKLGIAKKLLHDVIQDAKNGKSCLGNRLCKFILASAFNTGELLPMPEFYRKNGFLPTPEGNLLYLPIEGGYEATKPSGNYALLSEDRNKAIIFYSPTCEFSFPFAKKTEQLISEVLPNIEIELINEWKRPEELIKRKNRWLIVNAKPIQTFFMETEKFKEEIRQAASEMP